MAKLTAAQEKDRLARLAAAETPVEQTDPEAVEPASLTVMFGRDEQIQLGDRMVCLAMFRTKDVERGYALLDLVPAILTAQAYAAKDGQPIDLATLTDTYNSITGRDDSEKDGQPDPKKARMNAEQIAEMVSNTPLSLGTNKKVMTVIIDLVELALKRREKAITREEIEDEFDFAWFISFLRALLRVNTGLREAF